GTEFVEHGTLLALRHAIQGQDAGEIEIGIDDRVPERPEPHQVLAELLLSFGLRQDAGPRPRRPDHERAGHGAGGAPLRRKKLGKDRAHGMTEEHGKRWDRLEERFELGAVVVDPDTNERFRRVLGPRAVADEIGRVAGPTEALEHRLPRVEAPAPSLAPCSMTMALFMAFV